MGRLFFTIAVVMIMIKTANGQRYLAGQQGIEIRGGMVDEFYSDSNRSFHFGVGMSSYTKEGNHWVFGAEYLKNEHPYSKMKIEVSQLTAEGGYYLNFLSDPGKTFFLSLGASALAGYEIVNQGKYLLYDGGTLQHNNALLYGGAVTLELERYMTDRLVLLLNMRERIMLGTSIGKFHTQFGLGLKYIMN